MLVTGASRGIGRAISLELASHGFHVVVHYLQNRAAADETIAQIDDAGGSAELLQFDVADRAGCAAALQRLLERVGSLYGVVSNAGIVKDAPFPAMSDTDWDSVLGTNLDGFYNVVKPLVMPMVQARGRGRIVAISSVAGIVGNRGQVNYSAAKAGLIGATRALAKELAKREITVNCVAPGLIHSDLSGELSPEQSEEILKLIPMRRLGTPAEVAHAVGFLFSDRASYITGQVISVNGGLA